MVEMLYHYSKDRFKSLVNLETRGLEKEGFGDEGAFSYNKSISFFLEPIPLNIPELLGGEHAFWKDGQELYQYAIDPDTLPKDVCFEIVESYPKTDLVLNKQDWIKAGVDPTLKERYLDEIDALEKRLGHIGQDLKSLHKILFIVQYNYAEDYVRMYKLHKKFPHMKMMDKYAATVPHLMLYLQNREALIPTKVEKIKLVRRKSPTSLSDWK